MSTEPIVTNNELCKLNLEDMCEDARHLSVSIGKVEHLHQVVNVRCCCEKCGKGCEFQPDPGQPEPVEPTIYGYEWDYSDPDPKLTPLEAAIGLTAVISVGETAGHSDFDGKPIYKDIRRCNLSPDGIVNAYDGEPGFTFDGTNGDVMVEIPAFYYKVENDAANKRYRYFAANKKVEGFELHPAFNRPNGSVEKCYVGAYETVAGNASKSGVIPTVNQTRATMRTDAMNKGDGWSLQDLAVRMAVTELIKLEFQHNNVQALIGQGIVSEADWYNAHVTGSTNLVIGSGRASGAADLSAVVWRGMENLWGNANEWVDGFNFNDGALMYCLDQNKFADDTASGYTQLSYSLPAGLAPGYGTALGYDTNVPWAALPSAFSGGSESTYLCDLVRTSTGWGSARVGGGPISGSQGGICRWVFSSAPTGEGAGSRLIYYPQP